MRDKLSNMIVETLHQAGVTHAFGLPGTQNIKLFEALRKSPLRTVVAQHELGASFMVNGYYRASGRLALLTTIPGPGFTYALTGLAEARLDSAAVLHLTSAPARKPGNTFQLQAIEQAAIAAPLVKDVVIMGSDVDPAPVRFAISRALSGEPGPVLLQTGGAGASSTDVSYAADPTAPDLVSSVAEVAQRVAQSQRVVLLVGQGAAAAAEYVVRLAECINAAVVSTTSGRGVVAEDHRLSLGFEMAGFRPDPINDLIEASDLVLALGCKFSHNGSRGFGLRIPASKLVQVDTSAEVIGANYPADIGVVAALEEFLPKLVDLVSDSPGWSADELARWRTRGNAESWPNDLEPKFPGRWTAAEIVGALRESLPRDAIVVTDSGRHQMLVRRWLRVLAPRGLMVPTNLQSMGFALPAAIGAKLAAPERTVVAVLGDGGLLMSGLEILTAVKAGLALPVIVINDGAYGLIKQGQLAAYGTAPGSELATPDLSALAAVLGVNYARIGAEPGREFAEALALPGVTLIEVPAREAVGLRVVRAKGLLKRLLGPLLGRIRAKRGGGVSKTD